LECVFDKVDPEFATTKGFNCRLSVLLRQDGFSFLVVHAESNKILRLSSYTLSHEDCRYTDFAGWPVNGRDYFLQLQKIDILQNTYSRIYIAADSYKYTTAPYNFLLQDNSKELILAAHEVKSDEEILVEPVFDLGPAIAILLPKYISEYCSKIFAGSNLRSAPSVFVKGILRQNSQIIAKQVFINIHNDYFEITVIQGLRLQYLNTFRYTAPSDVLYYVVFILEQLGLMPSEQDIVLMGKVSVDSHIYEQLKLYCGSLRFAENPEGLEYSDLFKGIGLSQFYTLLNIPLCE
jgi:hypothetical protein